MTTIPPPPKTEEESFRTRKWKEQIARDVSPSVDLSNAPFVTMSSVALLSNERILTGSSNISLTDNGPGLGAVLDLANTGVTPGTYSLPTISVDAKGRVTLCSSTSEVDPLSIHVDGTSTTTAIIPFVKGWSVPTDGSVNGRSLVGIATAGAISGITGRGQIYMQDAAGPLRNFRLEPESSSAIAGIRTTISGGATVGNINAGSVSLLGGAASGGTGNGGQANVSAGIGSGAGATGGLVQLTGGSANGGANYGYVRVGQSTAPTHIDLTNADAFQSLFIVKHFEIDGTSWFDGTVNLAALTASTILKLDGSKNVASASGSDLASAISVTSPITNSGSIGLDETVDYSWTGHHNHARAIGMDYAVGFGFNNLIASIPGGLISDPGSNALVQFGLNCNQVQSAFSAEFGTSIDTGKQGALFRLDSRTASGFNPFNIIIQDNVATFPEALGAGAQYFRFQITEDIGTILMGSWSEGDLVAATASIKSTTKLNPVLTIYENAGGDSTYSTAWYDHAGALHAWVNAKNGIFTVADYEGQSINLNKDSAQIVFDADSSIKTVLQDSAATSTKTITLPNVTGTLAALNLAQIWTATQTISGVDILPVGTAHLGGSLNSWTDAYITKVNITGSATQIVFDSSSITTTTLNDSAATSSKTITLPNSTCTLIAPNLAQTFTSLQTFTGGLTITTADLTITNRNVVLSATTGTQFGTGTTQKLSFYGSTAIAQPANTVAIDTLLVNLGLRASGGVGLFDTDIKAGVVGKGLYVKEGSNATMGTAVLVTGTVVVSTTKVTASSRIFLTTQVLGTVAAPKAIAVTARTAGTSFTITSADATDTSTIAWIIMEPA